ncbi:hypothetical protein SLEP1_g44647 [Rubroshorea leprosula]|uniref:Uncharacterized protein n=1 Tax=Rubroshorea leprosula TaxID=152421 RepID=A0AAV5LHD0_9ROSI|nr:hypothetical protein SLEP1_g44647 [Rubroshorea leprosula]
MNEGPKLYTNKPKKAQLKQFQEHVKGKDLSAPSSSSAAAASYTMGSQPSPPPPPPSPPPSPPPPPPKESFARRYKFLWPLLLGVNLTVGVILVLIFYDVEEL